MSPEYPKKSTKMASAMQVLHAFQPFLRLFAVYNQENFQKNDQKIVRHNLLQAFLNLLPFVSALATISLNCWSCIRDGFTLSENSDRIVPILASSQQLIIYLSIIRGNREISSAIECLQKTVESRKLCGFES